MRKPKLTIAEQIQHMKESGIKFTIVDEDGAAKFLYESTYYFKIKAYAKNYSKYLNAPNHGKYVDLEFAYLKELSTIDSLLRKEIIKIALDIEHFLKVNMLVDFSESTVNDGYEIIEKLFTYNPDLRDSIIRKGASSTNGNLIEKYKNDFAIWNIVEVLSFGNFIELYSLYYGNNSWLYNSLFPIKKLRNAAAHNNCLINNLNNNHESLITPHMHVYNEVCKIDGMPKKSPSKKLTHPIIHDFIVLTFVFNDVVKSAKTRKHKMNEILDLFNGRMVKHREYFENNALITSTYTFVKLILDNLARDSI